MLISERPSVPSSSNCSAPCQKNVSTPSWLDVTADLIGPLGQAKSILPPQPKIHGRAMLDATSGSQLMTPLDFSPGLFIVRHHTSQVCSPQGHSVKGRAAQSIRGYNTADGL